MSATDTGETGVRPDNGYRTLMVMDVQMDRHPLMADMMNWEMDRRLSMIT